MQKSDQCKIIYNIDQFCYAYFLFNDEFLTKYSQIIDIFDLFCYNDKYKIRLVLFDIRHNSDYVIRNATQVSTGHKIAYCVLQLKKHRFMIKYTKNIIGDLWYEV